MLKPLDSNRCPVDQALEVVGGKWKPLVIWRLAAGTLRFSELERAIPTISQRMLTLQLRELERDGLVVRTVHAEVPPKVEYTLTAPALELLASMGSMGQWLLDNHAELRRLSGGRNEAPAESHRNAGNVRAFRIRK